MLEVMKARKKWDDRFMELAALVATWSRDPSTKVGAVIVDARHIVHGLGYNGFPRGVEDTQERYEDRTTKYAMIVHCETNAILNAAEAGRSVRGCTLYTTKTPCSGCAKLIIQSGITEVVTHAADPSDPSVQRWAEDANISRVMFFEAGVAVRELALDVSPSK